MENNHVVCNVCGGKGGWKSDGINWTDCGYCDGFGFYEDYEDENKQKFLLKYSGYKKRIIESLEDTVCHVEKFTTEDMGKTIVINILPYHKGIFSEFVGYILKLGYYSKTLDIKVQQNFYFEPKKQKYANEWNIILKPDSLDDLDGFVDIVDFWGSKVGGKNA
jgi:hypothetical protein